MEQILECLIAGDLLPWERHYFKAFLRALESRVGIRVRDLGDFAGLPSGAPLWLLARDWRHALTLLPARHAGPVSVSVLGMRGRSRWLGLFDRHWNPVPSLNVRLVAHSPYAFRFLGEMEKIPEPNLTLLPLPGLMGDLALREPGPLRVGVLSSLSSDANLALLVAVAHYISRQQAPVRFCVPEQGKLAGHFKAMVSDLELGDYFRPLTESLSMDVLLHAPLKSEHFIPVLWKGSQGVPVLASDLPGVEELVSDGHDGFVVPVNEAKPLGELICRFAENESLRVALGDRLRQGLAKRFPLDRVMEQYLAFFFPRSPVRRAAVA